MASQMLNKFGQGLGSSSSTEAVNNLVAEMFLILLVLLACTAFYFYVRKKQSYWTAVGVKQTEQTFLLGDTGDVIFRKQSTSELMRKMYSSFPEERFSGFYQFLTPSVLVRDPDLIKQMFVKDFDHFVDHRSFVADGADPLWGNNLFSLKGNRWRDMRATLSPSFTSSKMKMLFTLISECADNFSQYFLEMQESTITVELKDTCTRFTNDVIASVVFGVKCNSLEEPKNEFYLMGRQATSVFTGFWNGMKFLAFMTFPNLCKMLGMTVFSKKMRQFFMTIVKENIKIRESDGLIRQDMLHLLLEARKGRTKLEENQNEILDTGFATVQESSTHVTRNIVKKEISDLDITAQALIFFFAGFDTVSSLMCFMGHELAVNADIQKKLQQEIDDTLKAGKGKLTYEALVNMKYMDMVVSEALRKWPPTIGTDRVCVKPYTLEPVRSGEKPVHFKVGDIAWVPTSGLHWDSKYYPKPEVFDPERFSEENRDNINPYTYLPFGVGPRSCIGSRFALLEAKTLFFHLLSKFDLVVVEKTQIPLKLSKASFIVESENGFWVGLKTREIV